MDGNAPRVQDLDEVAAGWDRLQRIRTVDEAREAVLGHDFVGQHSNVTPHYLTRLASRLSLSSESRVLDGGCGTGGLTISLAEQAQCEVVGLDLSTEAVAVATEKLRRRTTHPKVSFSKGDFGCPSKHLGKFDVITSFGSSYWCVPARAVPHWRNLLARQRGTIVMLLTRIYASRSDRDREVDLQEGLFEPHPDWEGAFARAGFTVLVTDHTELDGLYFRAYLANLRQRADALQAEIGPEAASNYIGMFEQFLSYYDGDALSRIEIVATSAGPT